MDLLDSVMELLNRTPSPPINVVSRQLNNSGESLLLENSAEMEPNNLSQSAARVVATVTAAAGETVAIAQTFTEQRNLELKLPILSSSSSDSEPEESTNPTAATSAVVDGERAASPPPNCAICLGRCKNKCFTDSCMHQFCFKCLCEWSKVKPECPLCKQTFKSIIHNVKSIDQFEEYHVQPPTVQIAHPPFEMDFQEMRIFGVVHPGHNRNHAWNDSTHRPFFYGDFSATSPYSSASTGGGSLSTASASSSNRSMALSGNGSGLRNQYVYRGELLDLYRQEYPGAIANSGTLSQLWRRYVYDRKLYAMPVADVTGRFRESSARFYRDNPSQIHRLMPWINRDIVCLLRQTQHDVTTVLESINSALTLMNILSPAFRRRLQPFLGTKTAHFIHELNNFARSPYDMIGYDRAVQYSMQSNNEEIVIEFTTSDESTDNEQIDVAGDEGGNNNTISSTSRSRSINASSINAINLTIHNRLTSAASVSTGGSRGGGLNGGNNGSGLSDIQDDVSLVIDLRGESDNNETTSTAQATTNSSNYQNGQNAGTSEGDIIMSGTQPSVSDNIELTSGSSDECEFILERKPPHLRTPEMVSLDSASDSDVVFVDESKDLNKTSFSSSEEEQNDEPSGHKHHSRHHNKIAALVEAKKRNHSGNLVKSEQQDSQLEVYNLGASTSAALRLSLQKRVDKSNRSDNGASSSRVRRDKYHLRNNDIQSRAERQTPKRRGKCLDSESSHSSTSSSTTISSSSSSTTSSSNTSSSSSGEEYVASTSQRRMASSGGAEGGTRKSGRKVKKTKKRKASNSSNRRTNKRDSKKRKKTNNDYSSDDDDDNGHMGKNFALVMAINERQKRQNQKCYSIAQENDDEEDSDGENSWRLKAVMEPQRKQQQQRAKSSHKSNERKRQRKTPTQQLQQQRIEIDKDKHRIEEKRQKYENQTQHESESQYARNFYKDDEISSDESDNINLVQLKTKLFGQDRNKEINMEETNTNQEQETTVETTTHLEAETATKNWNNSESDISATAADTTTNTATVTTISTTSSEHSAIPTTSNTYTSYVSTYSPPTMHSADTTTHTTAAAARESTNNNIVESTTTTTQNDLFNCTDDSNDNDQNERIDGHDHVDEHDSNSTSFHNNQQQLPSSSMDNYHDNNLGEDDNDNNDDLCDDDDETLSNVPPNKTTLNESNVFADGTSMSTTTTDTILHDAAEQISSAAVNFYNPQQTFNTADFADENSTNSSSSDSSMSSSTTSLSSSSNSSSSNTNSYLNYEHS